MKLYEFRIRRTRIKTKEALRLSEEDLLLDPLLAADFFRSRILHQDREQFMVIYLGIHLGTLGYETVAIGGSSAVIFDQKAVVRGVILSGATSLILAHNHPSNSATPSIDDNHITKRMAAICSVIGVKLLDHLIVTDEEFYSYATSTPLILKDTFFEQNN